MLEALERHFIYFPDRRLTGTPADLGLSFEDVDFEAADGVRLHGWFVGDPRNEPLLWCHGNAGNISYSVELIGGFVDRFDVSVFIFDYRGYGRSDGIPSERGLYEDGRTALQTLCSYCSITSNEVTVLGQSLGSAVATELATESRIRGLILESAFTSVADMAKRHYRGVPLGPFLRTRFDSLSKIGSVQTPLLILHGDKDDLVPAEMGRRLFEAASEPKTLRIFDGCGHDDVCAVAGDDYFAAVRQFLDSLRTRRERLHER